MKKSRRKFLKGVAVTTVGTITAGTSHASPAAPPTKSRPMGNSKHRWAMVVDLRKCIGCQACTVACTMENQVPAGKFRTLVPNYEVKEKGGTVTSANLPRLCNHCENPPCIPVCPVQATYQRDDGIVVVDGERCVGCAYCVQACPYDARFINPLTHTADKCTFCVHRIEAGLLPACVETCVGGARIFGDLNNPDSAVSEIIASTETKGLLPEMGTKPQVYYVALDPRLQSKIEGQQAIWKKPEQAGQEVNP